MNRVTRILLMMLSVSFGLHAQTLDDYFKEAAAQNPGLQAMHKEFEAALTRVPQVNSLPDPNFSVGYMLSHVETRVGPQEARLSLSQMFPWFGTLKAQGNTASLMAEAKYQAYLDARNELYYQVAAAYYPFYELEEMLRLEQENLELMETYKNIATIKFENGQGTLVDVLRVDLIINDAKTNLVILEAKRKPLLTAFNKLLNRNEDVEVTVADTWTTATLPDGYRRDSLLLANPKLNELNIKAEAMKEQEKVAFKQGLPKLGVGLDYIVVGQRTDMDVPGNGKNALMPMVSVSLPIFRNKYRAAQKESRLMQDVYLGMKKDSENHLLAGYEDARFGMEKNHQYNELYRSQIQETEHALNLLFSAYANAGTDFEEVLRMQQQLLKYQILKASAITEYKRQEALINYITAKSY